MWKPLSHGAQSRVTERRLLKKTFVGANAPFPLRHGVVQDPTVAFVRETRALTALADTIEKTTASSSLIASSSLCGGDSTPFPHIVEANKVEPSIVLTDCGVPLQDAWERAPQRASEWRAQLLRILEHLHAANLYHNDIHPGNVMVGDDGCLKLIDFAWATFDTPNFPEMNMTPEDVLEAETLPDVFQRIFARAKQFFGETMPKRVQVVESMAKHMVPKTGAVPQKYRDAPQVSSMHIRATNTHLP